MRKVGEKSGKGGSQNPREVVLEKGVAICSQCGYKLSMVIEE